MSKHYDILIFGHPSRSVHFLPSGEKNSWVGGSVWYCIYSALAGGNNVGAVLKYAPEDKEICDIFPLPPEDIYYRPSARTMSVGTTFLSEDKEHRRSDALRIADPFIVADIPGATADVYYVAGLMLGDCDPGVYVELSKRGPLALDVQGLLRCPDDTGEMVYRDWPEKEKYFPYVTFLKTDAAEAQVLTGLSDRYEAAKVIHGWGSKEVLISHNTGMLAYDGREFAAWPVVSRNISGRSGRGDTTMAAYITERQRRNMSDALRYATATVSLKMESPGPIKASRAEIEDYMERFLKEP